MGCFVLGGFWNFLGVKQWCWHGCNRLHNAVKSWKHGLTQSMGAKSVRCSGKLVPRSPATTAFILFPVSFLPPFSLSRLIEPYCNLDFLLWNSVLNKSSSSSSDGDMMRVLDFSRTRHKRNDRLIYREHLLGIHTRAALKWCENAAVGKCGSTVMKGQGGRLFFTRQLMTVEWDCNSGIRYGLVD